MPNLFNRHGGGGLFKPLLTTEEKLLLDVQLLYLMETVHLATFNARWDGENIKKKHNKNATQFKHQMTMNSLSY